MRTYLDRTLKQSKVVKAKQTNILFNIGFALVLLLVVGGFLAYKYKGKMTPFEQRKKQEESRHYVLSKLQKLAAVKSQETGGAITGLPTW
jgi:hypothetical protein